MCNCKNLTCNGWYKSYESRSSLTAHDGGYILFFFFWECSSAVLMTILGACYYGRGPAELHVCSKWHWYESSGRAKGRPGCSVSSWQWRQVLKYVILAGSPVATWTRLIGEDIEHYPSIYLSTSFCLPDLSMHWCVARPWSTGRARAWPGRQLDRLHLYYAVPNDCKLPCD
jgi:hypothetical protein